MINAVETMRYKSAKVDKPIDTTNQTMDKYNSEKKIAAAIV